MTKLPTNGRSVEEWRGSSPDAKVPTVLPLREFECGRGAHLPPERTAEIERYCAEALRIGFSQADIQKALGASRSRVSRWCIDGLRKHGSATDHRHLRRGTATLIQMLWARIEVRGAGECWPWRGYVKPNGYGSLNYHGKVHNAHRLTYEALIGPVPAGLVIDHTCENKQCCNPAHLQVTGQSANISLHFLRRA